MASKVTRIGLVVVALIILVATWYFMTGTQAGGQTVRSDDYPANWTDFGLPEINHAVVRHHLTSTENLGSGIRFELTVDCQMSEVCEYYEREFGSRHWEFTPPRVPSKFTYYNEFTDGGVRVAINAMPDASDRAKTKVQLTLHEVKNAARTAAYAALRSE